MLSIKTKSVFLRFKFNLKMLRTTTCGALTLQNLGEKVTLCGWMQNSRDLGGMTFIDIRDRYGITQLVFNMNDNIRFMRRCSQPWARIRNQS
jgi:aspartyl-tRNA synthetase